MENYTLYKSLILLVKYIPIIGAFCMLLHIGLLLLGINIPLAAWLFGFSLSGTMLLTVSSYVLQFCNLHRLFIYYDFIVENCIIYQLYFGFGEHLTLFRLIAFLLGISLFIRFFIKRCNCYDI